MVFLVSLVDVGEFCVHFQSSLGESLHHVDGIGFVDIARACAACNEVVGCDAKNRDCFRVAHRQCLSLVLEKHHAFGGTTSGYIGVGFQVGFVGVFVGAEGRCLDEILQDALHADVKVSLRQCTTLHLVDDIFDL